MPYCERVRWRILSELHCTVQCTSPGFDPTYDGGRDTVMLDEL